MGILLDWFRRGSSLRWISFCTIFRWSCHHIHQWICTSNGDTVLLDLCRIETTFSGAADKENVFFPYAPHYVFPLSIVFFLFTRLDAVLTRLGKGVSPSGRHGLETSNTNDDGTEASPPRRRVRFKRTYKVKHVWGPEVMSQFFVTGATDAVGKPSHFCCHTCPKDCWFWHTAHTNFSAIFKGQNNSRVISDSD